MDIESAADRLRGCFPYYSISTGYIGNYDRHGDGRCWRIWVHDVQVEGEWGYESFHIKLGSTEEMNALTPDEWILLLLKAAFSIGKSSE